MKDNYALSFCKSMSILMSGLLTGTISQKEAAKRLRKAADWIEALSDSEQKTKPKIECSEPAIACFEHYKKVTGRAHHELTREKRAMIEARLKEGFTLDQLNHISSWVSQKPFYLGKNDTGTRLDRIDVLFGSREKVEKLLDNSGWLIIAMNDREKEIRKLIATADEHLGRGENEQYNKIMRRIDDLRRGI